MIIGIPGETVIDEARVALIPSVAEKLHDAGHEVCVATGAGVASDWADADYREAGTVVVNKRSLSPGFSGIPNPLFAQDNTVMLFGDGKAMMQEVTSEYKENR